LLRKRLHKDLLSQLDIKKTVRDFVDNDDWSGENVSCLFSDDRHETGDDKNPSMSIDTTQGKTFCFACDYKASSVVGLAEDIWEVDYETAMIRLWDRYVEPIIDDEEVEKAHKQLMSSPNIMKILRRIRGIKKSTVVKLKLGWQRRRLWIPIANKHGLYVDVRKYDLTGERGKGEAKIFSYKKGYGGARLFPYENMKKPSVRFLLEGEMDTILAMQNGLNAVTITSGALTMPSDLAKLFRDTEVIVVPDNDKAGLAGAAKRATTLARNGATVSVVEPPWEKGKDFTDWILSGGDASDLLSFAGAAKKATPLPVEVIDLELSDKEQETVERANRVLGHLEAKGAFFRNDDEQIFYSAAGEVMDIASTDFNSHLSTVSPLINQSSSVGRFIITHIKNAAMQRASFTHMGAWSLYREPATIFVHTGSNTLLRVDKDGATEQPNAMGEDHVLIEMPIRRSAIKWNPDTTIKKGLDYLFGLIARNIPCKKEDRYLVVCWTMGILFREYIRSKPLIRFVAKSSSGKSTATKLLSQLVYCEEAINPPASTVASIYYMARSHPLLLFDNIETRNMVPEFENFLLTASTGGAKAKRKLASDTGVIMERTNCLVCSNGIEPLTRSELINRTIEINLDISLYGRVGFHEFAVIKRITSHRDYIFSAFLKLSQKYVFPRILNSEVGRISRAFPQHSMERFNDYFALMALFLDAIWEFKPLDGWSSPHSLIEHWIVSQDKSVMDRRESTDDVLHFLESYIDRRNSLLDATITVRKQGENSFTLRCTTRELLNDFRILARQLGIKCPWQNERQLGSRLADAEEMVAGAGWTFERYKAGGKRKIKFTKKPVKRKKKRRNQE